MKLKLTADMMKERMAEESKDSKDSEVLDKHDKEKILSERARLLNKEWTIIRLYTRQLKYFVEKAKTSTIILNLTMLMLAAASEF